MYTILASTRCRPSGLALLALSVPAAYALPGKLRLRGWTQAVVTPMRPDWSCPIPAEGSLYQCAGSSSPGR
jgi:hypothetical protein